MNKKELKDLIKDVIRNEMYGDPTTDFLYDLSDEPSWD
jgi:hypothetical protein